MQLQFFPSEEQEKLWNVVRDGTATGDTVFERAEIPGRYFLVLNTASLNVLGGQVSYASFDAITQQLKFYYSNCM